MGGAPENPNETKRQEERAPRRTFLIEPRKNPETLLGFPCFGNFDSSSTETLTNYTSRVITDVSMNARYRTESLDGTSYDDLRFGDYYHFDETSTTAGPGSSSASGDFTHNGSTTMLTGGENYSTTIGGSGSRETEVTHDMVSNVPIEDIPGSTSQSSHLHFVDGAGLVSSGSSLITGSTNLTTEIEKLEEGDPPPVDIDPAVYTTDVDGYRVSMSGDADSNYTGDYDFHEVAPHYALDSVRQMGLGAGPRISELHEFMSPQSPGRGQVQEGNITTATTHRPDGIYVTSNGTMKATDTDEDTIFLPANRLDQQGSSMNLFGELRTDVLPLQDGSYSYRTWKTTVESTTTMDDFGTRYFIEENTEPGVAPDERYQWRGLGTGSAELENHSFGFTKRKIRTLSERRIATPDNTSTTNLLFWGYESETRTETLETRFDKSETKRLAYNEGTNGYGGDGGYTISHSESAQPEDNWTKWTLANISSHDWTYKQVVHDGWTKNLHEEGTGWSLATADTTFSASGTMGVRYDYQGNLIDLTLGTSATNSAVFGAITRTIDGHGDADSWSLSKSQRSQVMGSDRWDIEQEMTINQNEDFDGSMVYTKSPKVELVDGLPALQYDESLVTDIDASGEYSPSDHVVVKHNGAVIYDAVQGTPLPYDHPTDAFAFDDLFDTVGNIAPRVGPSHGPGGEAAQIFAGATVFPGDNPGTTTSSWPEFPGTPEDPHPTTEQPFRAWKTLYPTYDIEGNSLVRKGGALLAPGEEAVEGAWWKSAPKVPDPPSDSSVVGYSINGKVFDTAIGAYGALIGQVAWNTGYTLQESGRSLVNMGAYAVMGPILGTYMFMSGYELIAAGPNWARDAWYPEDDFSHYATGFLGGAAVELATGTLLAKVGQAVKITSSTVPIRGMARFRGEPFAFGTGTRSARVTSLVDEAATASGIDDLARYVDDVVYDSAGSYFTVENGRRVLSIGDSAFARSRTGQLLEASHELVHAQQFERFMTRGSYNTIDDAANAFFSVSDRIYARQERVAEHLSRLRIRQYLGRLTPQQWSAGTRYINQWRP